VNFLVFTSLRRLGCLALTTPVSRLLLLLKIRSPKKYRLNYLDVLLSPAGIAVIHLSRQTLLPDTYRILSTIVVPKGCSLSLWRHVVLWPSFSPMLHVQSVWCTGFVWIRRFEHLGETATLSSPSWISKSCLGYLVSEEFETIYPSKLQGSFVRFVHTPTHDDRRLIALIRDGSERLVQCETCGSTEYMSVEDFKNPQAADEQRMREADRYYVRCSNPKCSGRGSGIFLTAVAANRQLFGRLRNRFRT
jgi:hypothetical protein